MLTSVSQILFSQAAQARYPYRDSALVGQWIIKVHFNLYRQTVTVCYITLFVVLCKDAEEAVTASGTTGVGWGRQCQQYDVWLWFGPIVRPRSLLPAGVHGRSPTHSRLGARHLLVAQDHLHSQTVWRTAGFTLQSTYIVYMYMHAPTYIHNIRLLHRMTEPLCIVWQNASAQD